MGFHMFPNAFSFHDGLQFSTDFQGLPFLLGFLPWFNALHSSLSRRDTILFHLGLVLFFHVKHYIGHSVSTHDSLPPRSIYSSVDKLTIKKKNQKGKLQKDRWGRLQQIKPKSKPCDRYSLYKLLAEEQTN